MSAKLSGPSILALVGDDTGPTLWRCYMPLTALQRAGYGCGWDHKDAHLLPNVAPIFDGFLLPRMSWPVGARGLAQAWYAQLRRAGRFVVYDADDDLFSSELSARLIAMNMHEGKSYDQLEAERAERVWAMQQCDGVTVSTQRLATVVRSFTDRPVIVVPNAIDVPWFRRVLGGTRRQIQAPTIGWAGGRRPDEDVAAMAEAWARIAERYPAVTFVVQGWVPPIVERSVPQDRLVVIPWLPLKDYPLGLIDVDIACAAVADTPFNRCKSNIKVMEAAVAGSAVVATPTLYASLVEDRVSGYLAETADQWTEALAALVESQATRRMLARRLLRTVERTCSLAANLWRWPAAWATIAESARVQRTPLYLPVGFRGLAERPASGAA